MYEEQDQILQLDSFITIWDFHDFCWFEINNLGTFNLFYVEDSGSTVTGCSYRSRGSILSVI